MKVRPIDANALVEYLERRSEDYVEIHERLKSGDISKAVMYGKFTALVETMIDVKRMPTLDCVTQQQWISVKDRLPSVNQNVLYVPANNPQKVEIGKITAIGRCGGVCFTPCISDHPCNFYAKYWMPLPEPPKEERT